MLRLEQKKFTYWSVYTDTEYITIIFGWLLVFYAAHHFCNRNNRSKRSKNLTLSRSPRCLLDKSFTWRSALEFLAILTAEVCYFDSRILLFWLQNSGVCELYGLITNRQIIGCITGVSWLIHWGNSVFSCAWKFETKIAMYGH